MASVAAAAVVADLVTKERRSSSEADMERDDVRVTVHDDVLKAEALLLATAARRAAKTTFIVLACLDWVMEW